MIIQCVTGCYIVVTQIIEKNCVTTVKLYLAYSLHYFSDKTDLIAFAWRYKTLIPLSRTLCRMLMLRADTLRMEKSVLFSQTAT